MLDRSSKVQPIRDDVDILREMEDLIPEILREFYFYLYILFFVFHVRSVTHEAMVLCQ